MFESASFVLFAVTLPFASLLLALRSGLQRAYCYSLPVLPLPALMIALLSDPGWLLSLPGLLHGGLWGMDDLRRAFLLLTAMLWLAAGVFALGYMKGYLKADNLRRFCVFWALTLAGNLGLTIAEDIASFYGFFALMTFAAYGLVVHEGTDEANRAGRVYLVMAVGGEMAILAGLLMAAQLAGSDLLADLPATIAGAEQRGLIMLLLLAGFGVKAGLPLLHFWLPLAHPVAPTPASAVLSGAMIKAGLLGWLVTLPFGEVSLPGWGDLLVIVGAVGSLGGAVLGLRQQQPKTVLAYSSISQMGFITLMVGAALASADVVVTLFAVMALFALHHGLAKGSLFLATAMTLPRSRIGQWLMWLLVALPGLSLAGLPFTSGAVAKLAMKEVLKPDHFAFAAAPYLPALMSAGAVATMLLVWRFLWLQRAVGKIGRNPVAMWVGWGLSLAGSLILFWYLPWHGAVPEKTWPTAITGEAWSLIWPILMATLMAAVAPRSVRQR
ncbi:complex I subunit 5 family protein [Marinobacter profundi]|uniref:NADH-ubiquinone oxidoreductase n=1 Tax=Marinobacter profundi TaxID=2666256 RepID=A0A2G1UMZ8_9GAMM|nr:complex I subunit 5 family protein [Marinobacter profundi]PHQ15833.1 NADH-ubiquinone oxidoreductase [Marinobacter profundi]